MLMGMDTTTPARPRRAATLFALAGLCALAACGGGGGGSDAGTASPPAAAAPPAAPTPQPQPPAGGPTPAPTPDPGDPGSRATCNLPDFQATMLARVNAYRRAGATCGDRGSYPATGDLAWSAALAAAALVHSDDMVAGNFFSHTGSDGRNAGQRITAAGYTWSTWGENIAAGQPTVAAVVDAWMASPGHCVNLMNERFRDLGVACVSGGAGNTYRSYWTMKLATAR